MQDSANYCFSSHCSWFEHSEYCWLSVIQPSFDCLRCCRPSAGACSCSLVFRVWAAVRCTAGLATHVLERLEVPKRFNATRINCLLSKFANRLVSVRVLSLILCFKEHGSEYHLSLDWKLRGSEPGIRQPSLFEASEQLLSLSCYSLVSVVQSPANSALSAHRSSSKGRPNWYLCQSCAQHSSGNHSFLRID